MTIPDNKEQGRANQHPLTQKYQLAVWLSLVKLAPPRKNTFEFRNISSKAQAMVVVVEALTIAIRSCKTATNISKILNLHRKA